MGVVALDMFIGNFSSFLGKVQAVCLPLTCVTFRLFAVYLLQFPHPVHAPVMPDHPPATSDCSRCSWMQRWRMQKVTEKEGAPVSTAGLTTQTQGYGVNAPFKQI